MNALPSVAAGTDVVSGTPYLTQKRKAAIVVRVLLQEGVELSLTDLPEAMQEELTHEMGAIRQIDRATLEEVLQEFMAEIDNVGITFPGGLLGALNAADKAIAPGPANRLRKQVGAPLYAKPWELIEGLDAEKLAQLIQQESTEVAGVILSKLPVPKAAELLSILPADIAKEITYAVSQTSSVDPETVETIGAALAMQIDRQPLTAFSDGAEKRVGAILNSSPATTRDNVLDGLEDTDSQFAGEVRKAIFTFANIPTRIDPRDIAKVTRAVDQNILITAMAGAKGEDAKSTDFILSNMSTRMADQLRDEMNELGKLKTKDVEEAMSNIVGAIREMEAAGELLLITDEDAEEMADE
ncbi:MAG: FliG C-terminal domain-containing protein [Pseudomonadota bacterium]